MADSETYLKTRQVATALGVSVSTIQRWVDAGSIEATRTMGRHRRVLLSSVLEFARRERIPVENLLSLKEVPSEVDKSVKEIDGSLVERLADLLKQGRSEEASALIASILGSEQGAVGLADDLIRPVMDRIGHGWMVGHWDVYQEHQATQIVISTLTNLVGRAV